MPGAFKKYRKDRKDTSNKKVISWRIHDGKTAHRETEDKYVCAAVCWRSRCQEMPMTKSSQVMKVQVRKLSNQRSPARSSTLWVCVTQFKHFTCPDHCLCIRPLTFVAVVGKFPTRWVALNPYFRWNGVFATFLQSTTTNTL